jgi:tetratricopeptide (TPR) repeat protein
VHRFYCLIAAAALLFGASVSHAATKDRDAQACDNVTDMAARVTGCTRMLERKTKWPAKVLHILYLQRAQGYGGQLQYERAIEDYNTALKYNPNSAMAYSFRGEAYNGLGQYDRGLQDADKAIGLDPRQQGNYLGRARAWTAKGELDRAITDLDTAIKLDPQQAIPYNNRGHVWTGKGELDNALADCNQAIKLDANFALAYSNRGIVWFQKGELDSALSDFSRAIRIDPSYWAGYTGRGDVWRKKGELERALADFEQAIRISPRAARSFVSEGLIFEAQGQIGRARTAFKAALDLPTTVVVQGKIGGILELSRREQDTARARLVALGDVDAGSVGPLYANVKPSAPGTPVVPASPVLDRRIALVIGNGAYANAPQLANPANDARVIAKNLRDIGFEVSDGVDLDRVTMTRLIGDFLRAAANANMAMLFYAGHGIQIDGQNYLLPVDVKFDGAANLTNEMMDVSTILAGLDDGIRANIVILDACRDNPIAQKIAQTEGTSRSVSVRSGLASPSGLGKGATSGAGTLLAFATAPGQVALDGEGANSPFSLALARHISTPGLEVQQMLTRVRAEVVAATKSKQVPWSNSSLLGEVYLAGKP